MKNSFSFSRYPLLNLKNSAGQILGFHRFPRKICQAISVCDVTEDLYSQCEADFHTEPRMLFSQGRALRKLILKIFTEYFVGCPVELQGINNMLICPIFFSIVMDGVSVSVTINDHVLDLVVCDHVDGGIRLSSFILAGFIASENADLLYCGGPWRNYQCHSKTTCNQSLYQFGVQLLGQGPCGFPSFWIWTSNVKFCSVYC